MTPDGTVPDWLDTAQTSHVTTLGPEDLPGHTPPPDATTAVVVVPSGFDTAIHVTETAQAAEANTWLLLRTVQLLASLPPAPTLACGVSPTPPRWPTHRCWGPSAPSPASTPTCGAATST